MPKKRIQKKKSPAASSAKKIESQIRKSERKLGEAKAALAKLRRKFPKKRVQDFELKDSSGKIVRLSQLFGDKKELILVHNMGTSCVYCTMWADGFQGLLGHLQNRAAFIMESPDSPDVQRRFAKSRGWKFQMVSSEGTTFREEMGFQEEDSGDVWPGVSTFVRDASGKIFQVASSYFGPGDNFCVTWDLFDLLPRGALDWEPKYRY